ncbi:MAG: SUF system Fe-S cluster assembly regulator, partial [Actinomycetia bacterium]|nr:SUF system Fe-S cluster assembly regulator [Actinomycetes bacterium]
ALEGPIGITECIDDTPGECSHEDGCPVRGNWHRINEAIRQALDGINLAEMAQPQAPQLVSLGSVAAHNAELG